MGLEARCQARVGERTVEVKALLESDELILRGEHRARLAFASLDSVEASAGQLILHQQGEQIALDLGPAAERWAEKIRNPRTLLDKLGVKPGMRAATIGLTDANLLQQLRSSVLPVELPAGSTPPSADTDGTGLDLVFVQIDNPADLAQLPALRATITQAGAIWALHPKGRRDLKDTDVMAAGKAAGLVDNKVARVSELHSALRFVIPKAARTPQPRA